MDMDAITNLLISLVAGLAGVVLILLRSDIKQLRAEVNGFRSELNGFRSELNGFRAEMNGFRAEMNGRFDTVLATQKEHGERLARLETLVEILIGPFRSGVTDPETGEQPMLAFRGRPPDEAEEA